MSVGAFSGARSAQAAAALPLTLVGAASGAPTQGIADDFGVSAWGGYTSGYACLYTGGADEGTRVAVGNNANWANLTPQASGTYYWRVYSAASGGTLLGQYGPFTVAASALPSLPIATGAIFVAHGDSTYKMGVQGDMTPRHVGFSNYPIGPGALLEWWLGTSSEGWPEWYPYDSAAPRNMGGWCEGWVGDNTAGFLSRVPRTTMQRPKLVFVGVTVNDSATSLAAATRRSDLIAIINAFNKAGAFVVVTAMAPQTSAASGSASSAGITNRNTCNDEAQKIVTGATGFTGVNNPWGSGTPGCFFLDHWGNFIDPGTGAGVTYNGQVTLLGATCSVTKPDGTTATVNTLDAINGDHPTRLGSSLAWGWAGLAVSKLAAAGVISSTANAFWQSGDETSGGSTGNLAPYPVMGADNGSVTSTGTSGTVCLAIDRGGAAGSIQRNVGSATALVASTEANTAWSSSGRNQVLTITPTSGNTESAAFDVYLRLPSTGPLRSGATGWYSIFVDLEVSSDPDGIIWGAPLSVQANYAPVRANDVQTYDSTQGKVLPLPSGYVRPIRAHFTGYNDGTTSGFNVIQRIITKAVGNTNAAVVRIKRVAIKAAADPRTARGLVTALPTIAIGTSSVAAGIAVTATIPTATPAPTHLRLFLASGASGTSFNWSQDVLIPPGATSATATLTGYTTVNVGTPWAQVVNALTAGTWRVHACLAIAAGTANGFQAIGTGAQGSATVPMYHEGPTTAPSNVTIA